MRLAVRCAVACGALYHVITLSAMGEAETPAGGSVCMRCNTESVLLPKCRAARMRRPSAAGRLQRPPRVAHLEVPHKTTASSSRHGFVGFLRGLSCVWIGMGKRRRQVESYRVGVRSACSCGTSKAADTVGERHRHVRGGKLAPTQGREPMRESPPIYASLSSQSPSTRFWVLDALS